MRLNKDGIQHCKIKNENDEQFYKIKYQALKQSYEKDKVDIQSYKIKD